MAIQYILTTWAELSTDDRETVYNKLTLNDGRGSAMRNLINSSSERWFNRPMSIARSRGTIIGWSLWIDDMVWAFVKPYHRNKGVGKRLVKLLTTKITTSTVKVCNHDNTASNFWRSAGAEDTGYYSELHTGR